jgi:hypothetical protein
MLGEKNTSRGKSMLPKMEVKKTHGEMESVIIICLSISQKNNY